MRRAVKPILAFLFLNCLVTGIHANALANDTKIDSTIQAEITQGFINKNGNVYYQYEDGTFAKGLKEISGHTYYFNSAGVMQTGITIIDGKRYYFNLDNGQQEWGLIDADNGYTYYFLQDGDVLKGLVRLQGEIYFFNETSGAAYSGWKIIDN